MADFELIGWSEEEARFISVRARIEAAVGRLALPRPTCACCGVALPAGRGLCVLCRRGGLGCERSDCLQAGRRVDV